MSNLKLAAPLAAVLCLGLAGAASAAWDASSIGLVAKSATALRQAIGTAEHNAKGQAFEAMAVPAGGGFAYAVKVLAGDKLMTVKVDPSTGKVASTAPDTEDSLEEYKAIAKQKPSLAAAIRTAEEAAKGKALEASFKPQGSAVFEVTVAAKGDVVKTVVIDARTGKLQKIS